MLCCLHKLFYKKCQKNHVFAEHKKNNNIKYMKQAYDNIVIYEWNNNIILRLF